MSNVETVIAALEKALAMLAEMEQTFEVGVCYDNIEAVVMDLESIAST